MAYRQHCQRGWTGARLEEIGFSIKFSRFKFCFCVRLGRGVHAIHRVQNGGGVADQNPRTKVGTEETRRQGSVSLSYIRRHKYHKGGEYILL